LVCPCVRGTQRQGGDNQSPQRFSHSQFVVGAPVLQGGTRAERT
jgi:hypothetical protein